MIYLSDFVDPDGLFTAEVTSLREVADEARSDPASPLGEIQKMAIQRLLGRAAEDIGESPEAYRGYIVGTWASFDPIKATVKGVQQLTGVDLDKSMMYLLCSTAQMFIAHLDSDMFKIALESERARYATPEGAAR